MNLMKILWKKLKKILKRKNKSYGIPYERAVISYTDSALDSGIDDDSLKKIEIMNGDDIVETYPYDDTIIEVLEKKMPIDDTCTNMEMEVLPEKDPYEL